MYSRLDDALIDHRKVFQAGAIIGRNGPALVLGLYVVGLMWSNKHLTDGFLPRDVVMRWPHVDSSTAIADALVKVRLWERVAGGYQIHDFCAMNPVAEDVKQRRAADRLRKQRERANGRY